MERPSFLGTERILYGPWQALERAVARLLLHLSFDDIRLVGGSGDFGADIVALRNDERWVFQVKYHQNNSAVPTTVIDEVLHAAAFYRAPRAVIVTNTNLSEPAYTRLRQLREEGMRIEVWNGYKLSLLNERIPKYHGQGVRLYQYQREAVESIVGSFRKRHKAFTVMATGLGKTIVAGEIIAEALQHNSSIKVLVLAHRLELVEQFEQKLWRHLPKSISTHLWTGTEKPVYREGVTCATFESVIESLHTIGPQDYGLVVVDEAHHAGAPTYQRVLEYLKPRGLLGITATPWRGENLQVVEKLFGPPVFTMSIVDGMEKGFLAQIDYRMLVDNINWDVVPRLSKLQLSIGELNRRLFLPQRDEAVVASIRQHWKEILNPRGIVFCRTIEHAQRIATLINALGFADAACISNEMHARDRHHLLSQFANGFIQLLASVDVLNEGIDVPDVNIIVFLRVTHSRRIFVQQLGRGLRLSSGKKWVRVLDFVSDVRRVAAGLEMEREHQIYNASHHKEEVRIPNAIISFSNNASLSFFNEWLADIADIQDSLESRKLYFPPVIDH
jgi:superfamily II DNA or RNA helicase